MAQLPRFLAALSKTSTVPTASSSSPLVPGDAPAQWRAQFGWTAERGGPGLTVRLFRIEFNAPAASDAGFRIFVTADSRYRLWLNGRPLGFGPCKGSLARYHFEAYEIGPLLRSGKNVLAAEVRWFGVNAPISEVHSPVPGFVVQGPDGAGLDTPGRWRAWVATAVMPDTTPYIGNAHQFLNHWERVDLAREPAGWRDAGFDDSGWSAVVSTGNAAPVDMVWGVAPLRTLVPREIPALRETPARFQKTIQDRREQPHRFGDRPSGWTIAAGAGGELLLQAEEYATGFPEFEFSGGAGREVRIVYAEALGEWTGSGDQRVWRKGEQRDDFTRYEAYGYRDTLLLAGGEIHWEPFYWRAFRFIKLEVLPGPAPLTVRDARYRVCVYAQDFAAKFAASDPQAAAIYHVSRRTFEVGAHEIYDDSPYYEQLSYTADTRIEALASLHLCNNAVMPRRNLRLFLDTLRPDGLLDSRVPCQYARQTIPYFCLHWILMLEDYWRWVGPDDGAFVRECLVAVDSILTFFRARLRPDRFVGPTGGWNMVDDIDGWENGEPPSVTAGGSTYLTCSFVEALGAATRLHGQAGIAGDALRWMNLADEIADAVRRGVWDDAAGLFREGAGDDGRRFSQHAQAAAINAGIATGAQAKRILERLCTDESLIRAKSMQSFYVARALERAGAYAGFHRSVLSAWRLALTQHLTTWPEYPVNSRSDSHAWAAWPAVDYITTVLGIRPAAPGWAAARIAPQFGGLDWAEGEAPTPRGTIRVRWRKSGGQVRLSIDAPDGLVTQVVLPGQPVKTHPNGGSITLDVPWDEPARA